MTKKQKVLRLIMETGIDGASGNAYRRVMNCIEKMPDDTKKYTEFTLNDLYEALRVASTKWEKEIDNFLM